MSQYHQILEVAPTATIEQIKKAYRKKAKLLHPDVNNAHNAQQQFILLNEAYEYLLNTSGDSTNRLRRAQQQAQRQANYQRNWEQQERENARRRAQAYARMKYEEYLKSDIYKTTEVINEIANFVLTCVILLFLVGLPILLYIEHGPLSLWISAFILVPTSPLWIKFIIKSMENFSFKSLFQAKPPTLKSKISSIGITIIVNIFIFIGITLNTLIEIKWIAALYISSFIIGYFLSLKAPSRYIKYLIRTNIPVSLINFAFLINFLFSTNTQTEIHPYSMAHYGSRSLVKTIQLQDEKYQQYVGIRSFIFDQRVNWSGDITYVFEDGILGFRVAKKIKLKEY